MSAQHATTLVIDSGTYAAGSGFVLHSGWTVEAAAGAHPVITSSGGATAFSASGATNVTISGLTISGGAYGIDLSHANNAHISNNTLTNISAVGIDILDTNYAQITGNTLHNIGTSSLGQGIWFERSSHTTISNNNISYTGKFAIGGGTVKSSDSATDYNVITHNTIDHANQGYRDAGAINLFDDAQNSTGDTISFNTITNTAVGNKVAWIGPAIYLDNYVSGTTVEGNLMENNVDGVWVHLGHDNVVNGNVVSGSQIGMTMDGVVNNGITAHAHPTGNMFENNSVYLSSSSQIAMELNDSASHYALNSTKYVNNVYGGPGMGSKPFMTDVNHATAHYDFSQWRGIGFDKSSPTPSTKMTFSEALGHLMKS